MVGSKKVFRALCVRDRAVFLEQRSPCRDGAVIGLPCSGLWCAFDGKTRTVVWIVRRAQALVANGACAHDVQEPYQLVHM
jgi:hypothetical protein